MSCPKKDNSENLTSCSSRRAKKNARRRLRRRTGRWTVGHSNWQQLIEKQSVSVNKDENEKEKGFHFEQLGTKIMHVLGQENDEKLPFKNQFEMAQLWLWRDFVNQLSNSIKQNPHANKWDFVCGKVFYGCIKHMPYNVACPTDTCSGYRQFNLMQIMYDIPSGVTPTTELLTMSLSKTLKLVDNTNRDCDVYVDLSIHRI